MQDEEKIPRTARDALIIELLGDLGIVHDKIKDLPEDINKAISGSLNLVAKAVEDAENTASLLTKGIDTKTESVIKDIDEAVKNCLDKHATKTFSDMDEKIKSLQHKINSFDLTDPKGRRLSFILATTIVLITIFSGVAIYGVYAGASSRIDELNQLIYLQDKKERRGLSVLSPQAKEQYKTAAQNTSSN
ncbi:hypothetical protein [Xenorhabdus cabanillasii]|uniref:Uncharacterized protein n=1 Tax=Xenorhabdus cabanillasii JM26 TaxID=1427517 RepID=W1J439_9GAMM|nr:hypothetical protein [Xenorhabdus cabanillasii]PHM75500.1 hypothetical protein Xcab_04008 [Xenorhabdus cabanillasii JM26]CDL85522.1 conserved hypothetical protein [Xenorhabdus cabanillasii JM26]